ncbi:hypothetical protein AABB24_014540, partial [Solanum stoloniferum]
ISFSSHNRNISSHTRQMRFPPRRERRRSTLTADRRASNSVTSVNDSNANSSRFQAANTRKSNGDRWKSSSQAVLCFPLAFSSDVHFQFVPAAEHQAASQSL